METKKALEGLADFVRVTRTRKGLTQSDIPKRGGPSTGWVGTLEAGILESYPKPATIAKLAKALEVSEAEIKAALGEEIQDVGTVIRPSLEVIEGFRNTMRYPPTPEETSFIRAAEAEEVWYGPLYRPGFWNQAPDKRRGHFIFLEGLTRAACDMRQEAATQQQA